MPTYNESLSEYVTQTFAAEDEVLKKIRREIPERGLPAIMIQPEEAVFLQFLVVASSATRAVEIGTLGGYSGVWIARGLPAAGKLITLEMNEQHAAVARDNFAQAGVADKVELKVGNAHELLPTMEEDGPYDFIFIDANKDGYLDYLEWALANLEPGGVVAAHNAFSFGGKLINQDAGDESVKIMRDFNRRLAQHPQLVATIFPAGAGMAVAALRK